MQSRTDLLQSSYHGQCKIKVEILSNADEYNNTYMLRIIGG